MPLYDYDPSGYREWFINSNKYAYGTTDAPTVMPSQKLLDVVAMTGTSLVSRHRSSCKREP
jgi:hypothetical protein